MVGAWVSHYSMVSQSLSVLNLLDEVLDEPMAEFAYLEIPLNLWFSADD